MCRNLLILIYIKIVTMISFTNAIVLIVGCVVYGKVMNVCLGLNRTDLPRYI